VIVLARHGQSVDNGPPQRFSGSLDSPLTPRGRDQAHALADAAAEVAFAALWTSPLRRARETADIVGAALALVPRIDARLAESHRGAWEGRLVDDIARDEPVAWAAWRRAGAAFRFPGGESLAEHQARVLAVLEAVRAGDQPALVVAHGGTIRCAICASHPSGLEAFWSIPVPNAEIVPLGEATRA